jgi:hypothetical protein
MTATSGLSYLSIFRLIANLADQTGNVFWYVDHSGTTLFDVPCL